jgi:hypothetical protein
MRYVTRSRDPCRIMLLMRSPNEPQVCDAVSAAATPANPWRLTTTVPVTRFERVAPGTAAAAP